MKFKTFNQKKLMLKMISFIIILGISYAFWAYTLQETRQTEQSIKVGILHSLSGTMSKSEQPVIKATLFAIEQLNDSGGLLGRQIEPVVVNGQSDDTIFAQEAENLITKEKVAALFGCWTSSSRKKVKNMVEKYNKLLFYPIQYEGVESSDNIIYTGSTPNQQILPSLNWMTKKYGKKIYLIGSDYIYPHIAHEIILDYAKAVGLEIVGISYVPLSSQNFDEIIKNIEALQPDFIVNTLNVSSNIGFFKALSKGYDNYKNLPLISYSLSQSAISASSVRGMKNHYTAHSYFESIENEANRDFIKALKERFPELKEINAHMESAYIAVHLWALAVKKNNGLATKGVISKIGGLGFNAPEGLVYVDPKNAHLWKKIRISNIQSDGSSKVVWTSPKYIRPISYLSTRTKAQWIKTVQEHYRSWHNSWQSEVQ